MVMSDDEKKLTAYHEAGHAIVGRLVPGHDPVYKVHHNPARTGAGRDHVFAGTGQVELLAAVFYRVRSAPCSAAVSPRP